MTTFEGRTVLITGGGLGPGAACEMENKSANWESVTPVLVVREVESSQSASKTGFNRATTAGSLIAMPSSRRKSKALRSIFIEPTRV